MLSAARCQHPPARLLCAPPCPAVDALSSVSGIAYMAYRCVPPLKDSLPGRTDATLAAQQASLLQELAALVAGVKGAPGGRHATLHASCSPFHHHPPCATHALARPAPPCPACLQPTRRSRYWRPWAPRA